MLSPSDLKPLRDSRDLRDRLEIILAPVLGVYRNPKFPLEPTQAAIWVVNSPDDPPNNLIASGLECLVYTSEGYGVPMQSHAYLNEIFKIKLIQRDRKQHTTDAYRLILAHIPDCRKSDLIVRDRDSFEELVLTITQASLIV